MISPILLADQCDDGDVVVVTVNDRFPTSRVHQEAFAQTVYDSLSAQRDTERIYEVIRFNANRYCHSLSMPGRRSGLSSRVPKAVRPIFPPLVEWVRMAGATLLSSGADERTTYPSLPLKRERRSQAAAD